MPININGTEYSENQINLAVNNYTRYLESILAGRYTATQSEINLLDLNGANQQARLTSIISNLRDFNTQTSSVTNFDFNANGATGTADQRKDIDLLSTIVRNHSDANPSAAMEIYSPGVGAAVPEWASSTGLDTGRYSFFKTSGGYVVATDVGVNGSVVKMFNPAGELLTTVSGDPHVYESTRDAQGRMIAGTGLNGPSTWHFADDSTFILPDGSKIAINCVRSGGVTSNVYVARGIYVQSANQVAQIGTEFGSGRDTASTTDQEEGAMQTRARFLAQTSAEWDAANLDANVSGKRNGVFALVEGTTQWAQMGTDGNFYDNNSESWTSYLTRDGNQLFHSATSSLVNRNQLIARLDASQITDYNRLNTLNLPNDIKLQIVDTYLQTRAMPPNIEVFAADYNRLNALQMPDAIKNPIMAEFLRDRTLVGGVTNFITGYSTINGLTLPDAIKNQLMTGFIQSRVLEPNLPVFAADYTRLNNLNMPDTIKNPIMAEFLRDRTLVGGVTNFITGYNTINGLTLPDAIKNQLMTGFIQSRVLEPNLPVFAADYTRLNNLNMPDAIKTPIIEEFLRDRTLVGGVNNFITGYNTINGLALPSQIKQGIMSDFIQNRVLDPNLGVFVTDYSRLEALQMPDAIKNPIMTEFLRDRNLVGGVDNFISGYNTINGLTLPADIKADVLNGFIQNRTFDPNIVNFAADYNLINLADLDQETKDLILEGFLQRHSINTVQRRFLNLLKNNSFNLTNNTEVNSTMKSVLVARTFDLPNNPIDNLTADQQNYVTLIGNLINSNIPSNHTYASTYNTLLRRVLNGGASLEATDTSGGGGGIRDTGARDTGEQVETVSDFVHQLNNYFNGQAVSSTMLEDQINLFIGANGLSTESSQAGDPSATRNQEILHNFYISQKQDLEAKRTSLMSLLASQPPSGDSIRGSGGSTIDMQIATIDAQITRLNNLLAL